jgi:Mce-associated membrane protein
MTSTPTGQAVRRRASRAAGPAGGAAAETTTVRLDAPAPQANKPATKPATKPAPQATKPARTTAGKKQPRRPAHRMLVAAVALAFGLIAAGAAAVPVVYLLNQQKHAQALQARNQRFVDTATQLAVNMYSYKQDTIDENVNRMAASTSGPLHDKFSPNNIDVLKSFFRSTGGSAEAVVNGAALESFDDVADNAAVLVSLRVTMTDQNGNNQPSVPSRMRIIVHEDDNDRMTGYDLKWPDGGN